MKVLLKWPLWLLALFSQGKSFKANPLIGSCLLNRIGMHALRYTAAHAMTQLRWWQLACFATKEQKKVFHQQGFMALENYLSDEQLQAARHEVLATDNDEIRECSQGDTLTQRILLDANALASRPVCRELLNNKNFNRLLKYAAASNSKPLFYIQRIKNGYGSGADPQKNLHSDTFHPCMKAWLFLEDVTPEKGPFTYVPGSQRFTMQRLKWEYVKSCHVRTQPDGYSEKGSFRVAEEALSALKLPQPESLTVAANTLVIANTHGFHARGAAATQARRLEIWIFSRSNPFNPFAGIDWPWMPGLRHRILRLFWQIQDKKAAKKGSRSSWHRISARAFNEE